MGIIKRQGFKYSFVSYFGVVIGIISVLYIYPLNKEIYGLFRFVVDTSNIFVPFIMLGASGISIRFFNKFKNETNGNNGFLSLVLLICSLGIVLFLFFILLFWNKFIDLYQLKTSPYYYEYLYLSIPIAIIYAIITVLRNYTSNVGRVVIPTLLDQIIKITFPILLLFYLENLISLDLVMKAVVLSYIFYLWILIIYIRSLGQFKLSKIRIPEISLNREIFSFGFYAIIGSAGSMLALRIDTFMVGTMKELNDTGIYSIAALIATNIAIPIVAIASIAAPIVSKAWEENNMEEIKMIYRKSSINLLFIGSLLFMGVWLCVDDIFKIMPKGNEMITAKYVIFWIGISKLFDMATGVNDLITGYSKYYRFNFYTLILMAIINIICNLILIPLYGVLGAAYATAFSSIIYNLVKYLYIKRLLNISPFTNKTTQLILISLILYTFIYNIPAIINPYFSILLKGFLLVSLYIPISYYYKISSDINEIIDNLLKKIRFAK